jgi:glycosyltransferase involved in cell wall biosynthesis
MEKSFSVITASILRPTLFDTCKSIERQDYWSWEHVVVVDIPAHEVTPEQHKLLDTIRHPKRTIVHCQSRHKNYGNTCRNQAFKLVASDYLLYLDDDDVHTGEVFKTLNEQIRDEVWGIFPITRLGELFLLVPPGWCRTCSNQFYYKPLYPYPDPDTDEYAADGMLIDTLRENHPYRIIRSGPLARVDKESLGQ